MNEDLLVQTLKPLRDHVTENGIDLRSAVTSVAILFEGICRRADAERSVISQDELEMLAGSISTGVERYLAGDRAVEVHLEDLVREMRMLLDSWNELGLSRQEIETYRSLVGGHSSESEELAE